MSPRRRAASAPRAGWQPRLATWHVQALLLGIVILFLIGRSSPEEALQGIALALSTGPAEQIQDGPTAPQDRGLAAWGSSAEASSNSTTDARPCWYPTSKVDPSRESWTPWTLPPKLLKFFPMQKSSTLDPARFHLHIKLLTYDRTGPTNRFLNSLLTADYQGDLVTLEEDRVTLEIFVDHPYHEAGGWGKKKARERGEALKTRREMMELLDKFDWPHGPKTVHAREMNGGVQPQWMEAWWPEDVNQFAFIAEDDLELSPFFYIYFKKLVMFYYYNQSNFDPNIYGISFQRQYLVPGFGGNKMAAPPEPFLYELIGTWGQFVFPIPWKDFRNWYEENRFTSGRDPSIGNMMTTNFWKGKGNTIWTPWQVQWAYIRHAYNIYTGFPGKLALSVSHRTSGVNIKRTLEPDGDLITRQKLSLEAPPPWWTVMPSTKSIKKFDFCFRRLPTPSTPVRSLEQLKEVLPAFGATQELAIVPVRGTAEGYKQARNFLCSTDGLHKHNFMLLFSLLPQQASSAVPPALQAACSAAVFSWNRQVEGFAADLAARGHLVYILPGEGELSPKDCGPAGGLGPRKASLWSLEQAELVSSMLELGVDVIVSSLGSMLNKDPFRCTAALPGPTAHIRSWFLAVPSMPLASFSFTSSAGYSFLVWIKSSTEGKAAFTQFVSAWKALGIPEITSIAGPVPKDMAAALGLTLVSGKAPDASYCGASGLFPRGRPGAKTAPAVSLLPSSIAAVKQNNLWLINDISCACKSVICRK